jgi:hypothetical protein
MNDHVKVGEMAQGKLNILSSAQTSLKLFLHEIKTSLGAFQDTMGSHLNPQTL